MAALWSRSWPCSVQACSFSKRVTDRRMHGFRCCSIDPNLKNKTMETPRLLKIVVSGVTELLRLFSYSGRDSQRVSGKDESEDESTISNVDDVLSIIKSDYEKAYFLTGAFTSVIYAEDCIYEDPTIKFRGKELYARNLSLLVPFFDQPSIQLKEIMKAADSETDTIVTSWKLRTYLKLPWRPLISIDGKTTYDLDKDLKIIRHVEEWNTSALQAVGQIFTSTPEASPELRERSNRSKPFID